MSLPPTSFITGSGVFGIFQSRAIFKIALHIKGNYQIRLTPINY